jgi:hypothetical protein
MERNQRLAEVARTVLSYNDMLKGTGSTAG